MVFLHIYFWNLIIKKHDIVSAEGEIGIEKHVLHIDLHNIPYFDEFDLVAGKNIHDVPLTYGLVRSHILKVLMH